MRGIVATCAGIGGVAVGLWLMAGPARALTPSADAGAELAARWCAGCHVVAPSGAGTDAAPSFLTLARSRTADQLRLFLAKPHARPMRG
ncbi:MAG: c-type cytochrome, partial [Magnetospirillum sp.]|nr:c-type cytochrome [Magnetospirillum sp.]